MRYKQQIEKRLEWLDNIRTKLEFQINRREPFEEIEKTLNELKATTDKIREFVGLEDSETYGA